MSTTCCSALALTGLWTGSRKYSDDDTCSHRFRSYTAPLRLRRPCPITQPPGHPITQLPNRPTRRPATCKPAHLQTCKLSNLPTCTMTLIITPATTPWPFDELRTGPPTTSWAVRLSSRRSLKHLAGVGRGRGRTMLWLSEVETVAKLMLEGKNKLLEMMGLRAQRGQVALAGVERYTVVGWACSVHTCNGRGLNHSVGIGGEQWREVRQWQP